MAKHPIQIIIEQNNNQLKASMGGATPATTPQSTALVFEDDEGNPKVKRAWNMGDPWTDDYYFREWRTDEQIAEERAKGRRP